MRIATLLLSNGVLLAGLLWLGWSPSTVGFLFWFEAAVTGLATLLKVAASLPGTVPGTGKRLTYRRASRPGGRATVTSVVPRVGALAALPLFVVLYGMVLAAYGALLLASTHDAHPLSLVRSAVGDEGVRLAMLVIAARHLWDFWRDYVRGPTWQRTDPTFHFWRPFGLAFVTWLAFFLGFFLLGWIGSPVVVVAVIVVLKAVAEAFGALVDLQAGAWQRNDAAA